MTITPLEAIASSNSKTYDVSGFVQPPTSVEAPSSPADTQAQMTFEKAFRAVAGDDNEVDAYELQEVLNEAFRTGLTLFP